MFRVNRSRRNLRVVLLRWHRWCGAVAAFFVLGLSLSGMLANHAHTLGWDQRVLRSEGLLSLYGVMIAPPAHGAELDGVWYAQLARQLYRGEHSLGPCDTALVGVVRVASDMIAAQCDNALYLLTPAGELIERLDSQPEPMQRIARTGNRLLVQGLQGYWQVDVDAGQWVSVEVDRDVRIAWAPLVALPPGIARQWQHLATPPDLTWERFLLDLHTGRLFGRMGEFVVDIAGLLMIFLAVTGAWTLLARSRRL